MIRPPLRGALAPLHSAAMNPEFLSLMQQAERLLSRLDALLPGPGARPVLEPDWSASIAFRYRRRGASLLGGGWLEPVRHVAPIRLDDLKEVEPQKERLVRNSEQFVDGRPANNVLLTGARGTGKSSLVKACLNEFAPRGLRLIEIDKADDGGPFAILRQNRGDLIKRP